MKILLVQTSFLGDTILSTPVIAGLKTCYPDAELWMLTTPLSAPLVSRDPLLAGVMTYDKRNKDAGISGLLRMRRRIKAMQFDKVYSLHRSARTSLLLWLSAIPFRIGCADARLGFLYHETRTRDFNDHDVMRNLSILKGELSYDTFAAEMRLFLPDKNEVTPEIINTLSQAGGYYAVLVPGSVWKTKMWSWQGFRELADFLMKQGLAVILLGAAPDADVCAKVAQGRDVINLAGKTSIADAIHVVKHATLVVCNDSMSLHMASALKVPTVAIFCATSPAFGYGPWKNKAIVVGKNGLSCRPCRPHGSKSCPTETEACMKALSPSTVISAAKELLNSK
jgi:heptosyltransferase-2